MRKNFWNILSAVLMLILFVWVVRATSQTPGWLTRNFDNARSGTNPHETILNQTSVGTKGLVLQTIIPLVGDARGMEAQPLVLPGVKMKDGSTHDVMVLPSMANVVRGVDAETGVGLWQTTLGMPIQGSRGIDIYLTNDKWGCLSTGVIDQGTGIWYGTCWMSPDGSGSNVTGRFYMFGLNLADGSQAFPSVLLTGTLAGVNFNDQQRKVRASALFLNQGGVKTIIQCTGSVYMTKPGSGGWCFAFDVASHTFTSMIQTTAGQGANIWNSGSGPAATHDGSKIFALTATGNFDGVQNLGESLIEMTYTNKTLAILHHWTPYQDQQRTGQVPEPTTLVAGASPSTDALVAPQAIPVSAQMGSMNSMANMAASALVTGKVNPATGAVTTMVTYPTMATGSWADEDLGSSAQVLMEPLGVVVVAGKDGIAYPVNMNNLGDTTLADLQNPKANCAKLLSQPVWATVYGAGIDPCPVNPETLNVFPDNATAHLHMTPVQIYDPLLKQWTLFFWGENQNLHKWKIDNTGKLAYVAESHEYASVDVRTKPGGGMTGGFCSASTDGNTSDDVSPILVCSIPYGDANKTVTQGRMLVYDPIHLAADGSLKVLWDSQRWGISYLFNKFMPPTIWNGRVYLPNYGGGVEVFQLTSNK